MDQSNLQKVSTTHLSENKKILKFLIKVVIIGQHFDMEVFCYSIMKLLIDSLSVVALISKLLTIISEQLAKKFVLSKTILCHSKLF